MHQSKFSTLLKWFLRKLDHFTALSGDLHEIQTVLEQWTKALKFKKQRLQWWKA
jgi:hypothetical protein